MNKIKATISKISKKDKLHVVEFSYFDKIVTMMSLDLNENIKVGTSVILYVKPTQTSFVKFLKDDISIANRFLGEVQDIQKGELLSCVTCKTYDTVFESILLTSSLEDMNLRVNDKILVLLKASDLYIQEVLND